MTNLSLKSLTTPPITAGAHALIQSELEKCAEHYGYITEEAEVTNYATAICHLLNKALAEGSE